MAGLVPAIYVFGPARAKNASSAEYRKIISLKLESSAGNLIIADGFAD